MQNESTGEFGFIEKIHSLFSKLNSGKYEGIGDDCAVIPINNNQSLVITTDMLVENSHFLKNKISAYDLGWKSLAVNISDIASMGAKPIASFMSIAIPKDTENNWKDDFIRGYYEISEKYSTELLGGDTTASQNGIIINITAVGICENNNIKRRASASVGDLIVVTSNLGDSACGLKLILENKLDIKNTDHIYLEKKHHAPKPHVEEGVWLGNSEANAMMDISDGISSDISHICKQSKCGAIINLNKIPYSKQISKVCQDNNWNKESMALSGGEDYSLLFTISKKYFEKTNTEYSKIFNENLNIIGEITSSQKIIYIDENGCEKNIPMGFRHF